MLPSPNIVFNILESEKEYMTKLRKAVQADKPGEKVSLSQTVRIAIEEFLQNPTPLGDKPKTVYRREVKPKIKITFSIPDELGKQLEKLTEELDTNRTLVIRTALLNLAHKYGITWETPKTSVEIDPKWKEIWLSAVEAADLAETQRTLILKHAKQGKFEQLPKSEGWWGRQHTLFSLADIAQNYLLSKEEIKAWLADKKLQETEYGKQITPSFKSIWIIPEMAAELACVSRQEIIEAIADKKLPATTTQRSKKQTLPVPVVNMAKVIKMYNIEDDNATSWLETVKVLKKPWGGSEASYFVFAPLLKKTTGEKVKK